MPDLTTLVEYGSVGIAVALIILIAYIIKIGLNLIGNHINHNTDAIKELTVTISELKTWLKMKNGN